MRPPIRIKLQRSENGIKRSLDVDSDDDVLERTDVADNDQGEALTASPPSSSSSQSKLLAMIGALRAENGRLREEINVMDSRINQHEHDTRRYSQLMDAQCDRIARALEESYTRSERLLVKNTKLWRALKVNFSNVIGDRECIVNCGRSFEQGMGNGGDDDDDDEEDSILGNSEQVMKFSCGHFVHASCASRLFDAKLNVFKCPNRCHEQSATLVAASELPLQSDFFGGQLTADDLATIDTLVTARKDIADDRRVLDFPRIPMLIQAWAHVPPSREFPLNSSSMDTPPIQMMRQPALFPPSASPSSEMMVSAVSLPDA
jgi:hypothetical protein